MLDLTSRCCVLLQLASWASCIQHAKLTCLVRRGLKQHVCTAMTVHIMHAGTLVGEDANQALQADINADPTTRLEAATLYRDTSGWLARVHSAKAAESAKDAQGPDAEGQGLAEAQPRDRILEVEDGGLEGGQEGVAQEPAAVKQERERGDAQQLPSGSGSASEAEPVRVKEEEAEESRDKSSVAIFGDEIASDSNVKHEDDSADPQLRQDQAAATQDLQSNLTQMARDSKDSLGQQNSPELLQSIALADHSPSDPPTAKRPLPAVQTFTVLCRENGLLQIFALPDMQLLFSYTNPTEGPPLLTQGGSSPHQPAEEEAKVRVVEARMESFGPRDASGDVPFEPMLDLLYL